MKKVKLVSMDLQNYKCFSGKSFLFAKKTVVSGRNRVGKTTLMDAYFDILTGKLSTGAEPADIRPHDKEGNLLRKADVVRVANIDIDGKLHSVKKVDFEKWIRPRGNVEEVFKGNGTTYEVDGIPMKTQKEFVSWLADNIAPVEDILLCSNPKYFLGKLAKSSVEARKTLEKISGFDAEMNASEEFAEALAIMGGHSAEDTIKRLRNNLSKAKDNQEKKNTEIAFEAGKQIKTDFTEELDKIRVKEAEKEELSKKLELLEGDTDKNADLRSKYNELQNSLLEYDAKMRHAEVERISLASRELRIAELALTNLKDTARTKEKGIEKLKYESEQTKKEIRSLGVQWQEQNALEFKEGNAICPYCGQRLPEEKVMEMLSAFNAKKASGLKTIEDRGNTLRDKYAKLAEDIAGLENELEKTNEQLAHAAECLAATKKEHEELMKSSYKQDEDEYRKDIVSHLEEANETLKNVESADVAKIKSLRGEIGALTEEIANLRANVMSQEQAVRVHKLLLMNLNDELLDICDGAAKIEREIQCILDYSIKKNQIIEEMVNKHFHHFQFKFLEFTQEGNPVEVCNLMVDGTAYNGLLNGGDKRLAEVDICRGFQEMKGLNLPIWLDEAGTVDAWRIPETEQQLICIRYAEHDEIEVRSNE